MLESFIQWQKERPSRRVNIEIRDGVTIWVYDTSLMAGQYVTDVREIDLEGKREERERREFERLSAKFNGKGEKDATDCIRTQRNGRSIRWRENRRGRV